MDSYVKEKLREWNLSSLTDVLEGKCLVFPFLTAYKPLFFRKKPKSASANKLLTASIIQNKDV